MNIQNIEFDFVDKLDIIRVAPTCEKHGTKKVLYANGRGDKHYRCLKCKYEKDSDGRRKVKMAIIKAHGGKCSKCGYDNCPWALEMHHRIPELKSFAISNHKIKSFQKLFEESKKCILLCANCHRELHAGFFDISEIPEYEIAKPIELMNEDPELFDKDILEELFEDFVGFNESSHSSTG